MPEAIYKELPPRLQKEVQVDRTRAPSLSANWSGRKQIETAARKWNKNKTKEIERLKIIKRKKSASYSSQFPPREQWNKAIWGNHFKNKFYACREILIVVFSWLTLICFAFCWFSKWEDAIPAGHFSFFVEYLTHIHTRNEIWKEKNMYKIVHAHFLLFLCFLIPRFDFFFLIVLNEFRKWECFKICSVNDDEVEEIKPALRNERV